ncbi:hypothetical protein BJV82DRAFT_599389 [Fennellomyces sp. T-0311]|nr:hypothetical protein BJV82DRAFT_599389 [Fennellomyces sp. T-0311]
MSCELIVHYDSDKETKDRNRKSTTSIREEMEQKDNKEQNEREDTFARDDNAIIISRSSKRSQYKSFCCISQVCVTPCQVGASSYIGSIDIPE